MSTNPETVSVAVLAVPDSTASTLYGMHELFASVGRDWDLVTEGSPGKQRMISKMVAADSMAFRIASGVLIHPEDRLTDCPRPDLICIPDIFVTPGQRLGPEYDRERAWVRECLAGGTVVAAACSGALLLAEEGLLDGVDATTHWAYCDALRRDFPKVNLHPNRSLVVTGEGQRIVLAGGGTSWYDLALYLIARFVGVEEAMQTARLYLINWHEVGQQPFAALSTQAANDDQLISECQRWAAMNYESRSPVAAMCKRTGLTERSLARRFVKATGLSPLQYIHTLRIEEAKHMLERTDESVESIAMTVGYEDASFFGRLFRRQVGITPSNYRKRFGSLRDALTRQLPSG